MTPKEREAMQQALEALEAVSTAKERGFGIEYAKGYADPVITALREALAEQVHTPYCKQAPMCKTPCGNSDCVEQAEQEPVAWMFCLDGCNQVVLDEDSDSVIRHNGTPLVPAPQPVKELTDDEIDRIACNVSHKEFARAVIAADREKNK